MVQAVVTIPRIRMADGGRYKCTAGEDRRNITEPTEAMAILCVTRKLSVRAESVGARRMFVVFLGAMHMYVCRNPCLSVIR